MTADDVTERAEAALPLPADGCACTPHEQDAGGGHTEYLLEYEPACPEHSEHLWSPKQGEWVLRSEHDAAVAAKALRSAAHGLDHDRTYKASDIKVLLYGCADQIEREAGESDADA